MKVLETARFATSFVLVVAGVYLELRRIRDVETWLRHVRTDPTEPTTLNRETTVNGPIRSTFISWKTKEEKEREALERLASSPEPNPALRRSAAVLAVFGGTCALVGSLLAVWHH